MMLARAPQDYNKERERKIATEIARCNAPHGSISCVRSVRSPCAHARYLYKLQDIVRTYYMYVLS